MMLHKVVNPHAAESMNATGSTGPTTAGNSQKPGRTDRTFEILSRFDQLPDAAHVRLPVVVALRASSPATVWRHVKNGLLPKPKKFGRTTAWNVGELRQHLR